MFGGTCKSSKFKIALDKRFTLIAFIKDIHSRLIFLLTFSLFFYKLSTNRRGAANTSRLTESLPDDEVS